MITIFQIKPADGGFGLWERKDDPVRYEGKTLEDYLRLIADNNDTVEVLPLDDQQVAGLNGLILNQGNGILIGYVDRYSNEEKPEVSFELVYLD